MCISAFMHFYHSTDDIYWALSISIRQIRKRITSIVVVKTDYVEH